MLSTINLDDKFLFERNEINDIIADALLAAELNTVNLAVSEDRP